MTNYINNDIYEIIKANLPIACVDLLVLKDDKVLLLKRNNTPALGQWWYPGGRIFKNESFFEAAVRKGKEELGLDLKPLNIVSVEETIFNSAEDSFVHTINIVVLMEVKNKNEEVILDKYHSEYRWFDTIDVDLHTAVKNPLNKINFKFGM